MSTYSPSLRIELITTGDQAGTWGTTTNTNMGTLIESAIAGYTSVSITSANQALTALNGAADESRNMTIALTTTTTADFNVYAPPAEKTYIIYNTSAYTATIYNSTVLGNTTAAGTGVAIPAGKTMTVWSDGTNFRVQNDHLIGTVVGNVTGNLNGNLTAAAPTAPTQPTLTNNTTVATTAFVQSVASLAIQTLYPVGSVYINAADATNPATLLGFGTWTEIGAGRVLVGQNASDTAFDTLGETGGSKDAIVVAHTHTGTTVAAGTHSHTYNDPAGGTGWFQRFSNNGSWYADNTPNLSQSTSSAGSHSHTFTTASTGSSGTNANLQPYVVVKMWQRTA